MIRRDAAVDVCDEKTDNDNDKDDHNDDDNGNYDDGEARQQLMD